MIDQSLYEVVISMRTNRFTTRQLRDLFASRLQRDGVKNIPIAEVRLYVYEHIRRMEKAGWISIEGDRKKRGQVYLLNALPENLQIELRPGRFYSVLNEQKSPPSTLSSQPDEGYESLLRNQLKELELEMLASIGEVERYKLLVRDMPGIMPRIHSSMSEARERSSKLIGHFRALENALKLLKTA